MTELCKIMKLHGSDKGDDWHNYTLIYYDLFKQQRNKIANLFEVGIGSVNPSIKSHMKSSYSPGGSLRGWRDFFPNANIYAADIDKDILQPEHRIQKFFVDQTNAASITQMWDNQGLSSVQFDIIIDDGLHTFTANHTFFEHSHSKLTADGVFIIEDIPNSELAKFQSDLSSLADNLGFSSRLLRLIHPTNSTDNNLMIITKNQFYVNVIDSIPNGLIR